MKRRRLSVSRRSPLKYSLLSLFFSCIPIVYMKLAVYPYPLTAHCFVNIDRIRIIIEPRTSLIGATNSMSCQQWLPGSIRKSPLINRRQLNGHYEYLAMKMQPDILQLQWQLALCSPALQRPWKTKLGVHQPQTIPMRCHPNPITSILTDQHHYVYARSVAIRCRWCTWQLGGSIQIRLRYTCAEWFIAQVIKTPNIDAFAKENAFAQATNMLSVPMLDVHRWG